MISCLERRAVMKQRITAFMLSAALLAPTVSAFAAEREGKIYFSESYNGYVTNKMPDKGEYAAEETAVCEDGKNNKALALTSSRKNITASFPINCEEDKLSVSFDVEFSGALPDGTLSIKNGNTESKVLVFDSEFGIKTSDGATQCGFGLDKKTNIRLTFEKESISVAVNGKTTANKRYIQKGMPAAYGTLKLEFKPVNGKSTVKLDNVYAYTGNPSDFPVAEYNPETAEPASADSETAQEVKVGNTVFIDKDFEIEETQKTGFFLFSPKSNTLKFETDKKTGNKYLKYTKNGTEDGLFDFSFGTLHSDARYFVMDFDMKLTQNNPKVSFNMNSSGSSMNPIIIETGGKVTSNGEQIYQFKFDDKWVHFAICMDYVNKVNKIYINNEYIGHEIDFNNFDVDFLKSFRSYFYNSGSGSVMYDNIRFYEAKEPKENLYENDDDSTGETDMGSMPQELGFVERAQAALGNDYAAISYYANRYYAKGEKKTLKNKCFINDDGLLYLPLSEIGADLDCKVDWNSELGRVIINDNAKWMKGDAGVEINGQLVSDKGIPVIMNDEIYFPARFLAEDILNKTLTWDEKQFIIIGNGTINNESKPDRDEYGETDCKTTYWEIADMLNYDNPTAAQIKKAYSEASNGAHPRIMINSADVERMKGDYESNEMYKKYADTIIAAADKLVEDNQPTEEVKVQTGNYLQTARQILDRVQKLGYARFITGDNKYAEQAWAELHSVGSFATWDRGHWLDLAEFQAAFAFGYDWFFDYWTDEQKQFIKTNTLTKAFNMMVETYKSPSAGAGELARFNNRSIVMASGTSMTAIAQFEDNPDFYAELLSRTIRNEEIISRLWYPDGAWPEGAAYWGYTASYQIYLMASLDAMCGTDFRMSEAMGFKNSYKMHIVQNMSVGANNMSDVGDMSARAPGELSWIARKFNDDDAMIFRVLYGFERLNNAPDMFDVLFGKFDITFPDKFEFPLDGYLRDVELATLRSDYSKEAACVSIHGGMGARPHGHYDIGSYVIDMLGERFAYDYGSENYAAASEGTSMYRNRAEGHNCLVFNPDLSVGQTGDNDFSPITAFKSDTRSAFAILDMTEAYAKYTSSCKRGIMLANDRRSVVVRDEFTLKSKVPVYWFLQTKASVELVNRKTAILTNNGKKVKLEMLSSSRDAKFVVGEAKNLPTSPKTNSAQTENKGYTKLMIQFDGSGSEYIEVRYIPYDDPAADSDMSDTPLSEWQAEGGEIVKMPELTGIYVDGKPIEDFDPETKYYTTQIPDTYEKLPEITASADDAEIIITPAKDASEKTQIKVKKSEYVYSVYQLAYQLMPTMPDMNTLEELKIVNVKASAEPQAENNRKMAIDRNTDTRWAAQDTCWIEVELDRVYDISRVGLLVLEGTKRKQIFNIEVSEDGKNYTKVYDNMSSGTTDDCEYYNVSGARGKYVRINCFGTSIGNWNSIKEIYVYKNK